MAWSMRVNASPSITVLRGLLGEEIESAALIRSVMIPGRMNTASLNASTLKTSTFADGRLQENELPASTERCGRVRFHMDAPVDD